MLRHVLHTADLHIGKNRKYNDYLDQQKLMLKSIVGQVKDLIRENPEDEVWLIVAGDVFDKNQDTNREELALFLTSLLGPIGAIEETNFRAFFIDGNHDRQPPEDSNGFKRGPSVLSPLRKFIPDNTDFAIFKPRLIEDAGVLMVPFGGYTDREFSDLLRENPAPFVIAHECLAGVTLDSGYKMPREQEKYIDAESLISKNSEIVSIFLGDIHRSQCLDKSGVAWFSGSPVTLDHSHKLPKGLLYHRFSLSSAGRWKRDNRPDLIPVSEQGIRSHYQLGVLSDENNLPMDRLSKFQTSYLQLLVTPEVYAILDKNLPGFFTSPHVTWDYVSEHAEVELPTEEEDQSQETRLYYRPLIETWVTEEVKDLPDDEKTECLEELFDIFDNRE